MFFDQTKYFLNRNVRIAQNMAKVLVILKKSRKKVLEVLVNVVLLETKKWQYYIIIFRKKHRNNTEIPEEIEQHARWRLIDNNAAVQNKVIECSSEFIEKELCWDGELMQAARGGNCHQYLRLYLCVVAQPMNQGEAKERERMSSGGTRDSGRESARHDEGERNIERDRRGKRGSAKRMKASSRAYKEGGRGQTLRE